MTTNQESQESLVKNSDSVQNPKSQQLNPVVVAADFGGIGTKAFASYIEKDNTITLPLFMGSEIAVVNRDSIELLQKEKDLSLSKPEHRAWCSVQNSSSKVIGSLAKKFHGFTLLQPAKYELAIFKTLALLWVVKEKLNLPTHFDIKLGLLIPPGEYNDRFELQNLLIEACKSFDTPSGKMSVNILDFDCKPESGGIILYLKKISKYQFEERNISVVMLGYRNASLICLKRGQVVEKISSQLGMHYMVKRFAEFTGKNNPLSELMPIIVNSQHNSESDDPYLCRLISTTFINNKDYQLNRLKQGITNSRAEYLQVLKNWLSECIPLDTDLIVYCGGTAEYLREDLSNFKSTPNINVCFFDSIKVPLSLDIYSLKERVYDLYCYFKFMIDTFES